METPLLQLDDLKTHLPLPAPVWRGERRTVKAVDGVSLSLGTGEVLGLVGESGCGKSTLARTVVRLAEATSGRVLLDGTDITRLRGSALRMLRSRVQMVFQDPYASLNPRRTVYDILAEPLIVHKVAPRSSIAAEVAALMDQVGLARRFVRKYPHEFSGGQRQRIAIARALAPRPELILADEPVSALDVSVQAQILNLLRDLSRERQLAMLLISHDLNVVKHMAQRIAVMYLGRIVEIGPAQEVFHRPQHPYTRALVSAVPIPGTTRAASRRILLHGDPPSPIHPPEGCPFHPRCPWARPQCVQVVPPLEARGNGQLAACIRLDAVAVEPPRLTGQERTAV